MVGREKPQPECLFFLWVFPPRRLEIPVVVIVEGMVWDGDRMGQQAAMVWLGGRLEGLSLIVLHPSGQRPG